MTAGGDKADRINFADLMQKKFIYTRNKSRMAKNALIIVRTRFLINQRNFIIKVVDKMRINTLKID